MLLVLDLAKKKDQKSHPVRGWVGSHWKEETHPGSHVQARGWVSENNSHPSLQLYARGWAFAILCGAMHVSISKTLKTKHTLPIVTDDDGHDVVEEEKKCVNKTHAIPKMDNF